MNKNQTLLTLLFISIVNLSLSQVTHLSPVTVERASEILMELEDSGGDFTGQWTMNDGIGNMAIKLGIDNDGNFITTNDGASEVLWGAHGQDGYVSLNAAKQGTSGNQVSYGISLIVNSVNNSIEVDAPNNSTGGVLSGGLKIADSNGELFTDKLQSRSSSGLDINLGGSGGDLLIYDAAGTQYILGDQVSGDTDGIVLRTSVNPAAAKALFVVESSGYSERLRVEHDGALSTTNHLHVKNDGNRTNVIEGKLRTDDKVAIGTSSFPEDYKLVVDGKAIMEEVKVELSDTWPDYVFEEDYDLRTLQETEAFIKENKHLPEIPSAEEIEENGLELGEMNRLLLKKIEELTLHLIESAKQAKADKKELLVRIEELENRLNYGE